ncbi:hypothetical protein [Neoroseomonas rubea]|uniref:hypothetical protein n=1 Tax=Neoroseomonas rubea TaxID=2748666 RepID=UPI0018DFC4E9|nr:hypothetical protein [Roseomonas rubea]
MRSKTIPREMRALARRLPLVSIIENGRPLPYVSVAALHRALGIDAAFCIRLQNWAEEEWAATVLDGTTEDVGPVVQEDGRLVLAHLAILMAVIALTDASLAVCAYLEHAELRHRIISGGALTAIEVAKEYDLTDRRRNCSKHIGDALVDFAARTEGVPRVTTIGPKLHRVRGFPPGLVTAWFKRGGGAELIERERNRPMKPRAPRPEPDYEAAAEMDAQVVELF